MDDTRLSLSFHCEVGISWVRQRPPRNRHLTFSSRITRRQADQISNQVPSADLRFGESQMYENHQRHCRCCSESHCSRCRSGHNETQLYPSHADYGAIATIDQQIQASNAPRGPQLSIPASLNQLSAGTREHRQSLQRQSTRLQISTCHERGGLASSIYSLESHNPESSYTVESPMPQRKPPCLWKELPTIPGRFRLGEEGMPWLSPPFSALGEAANNDIEGMADGDGGINNNASSLGTWDLHEAVHPTVIRGLQLDDRERGQIRETESLAAALITVDNGFEDQWWYQGPRLVNIAGEFVPSTTLSHINIQGGTLGWATADTGSPSLIQPNRQCPSNISDVVSPMTDFSSTEIAN
ncbi:hypothetical protein PT974_06565 [Cladobotryum mycophilum]|uniref:Uncharacterized protein n=1 Tax=Cladobotryum mycophilum TaxID=491253 RepID=A0ABR0SML3_9HYPO